MSRESKIIQTKSWEKPQDVVSHYEAFGWELLSLNGNQITMSRETQVECYTDLVKFQASYEEKKNEYDAIRDPIKPAPITFAACFWTFILAVFPLAIYLTVKIKKNQAYKEAVSANDAKRAELISEMNSIVLQSRGVFFAKHN